jgi:hypothetical protein
MAKIILRGNQESTLIWALELARSTFDGLESEMTEYKEIDNLLESFKKQLAKKICKCGCGQELE